MLMLCDDILYLICDELTNRQKISLSSTSKNMNRLKYKFIYHEQTNIHSIYRLPYFDNFKHIKMGTTGYICCRKYGNNKLPAFVTHLEFNNQFNSSIDGLIPSSVTHLTFGWNFNQKIINNIPASVTHLTFGYRFNQSIENILPLSITHLAFDVTVHRRINATTVGHQYQYHLKTHVPESVTHLIFNKKIMRQDNQNNIPMVRVMYDDVHYPNIIKTDKQIIVTRK